MTLIIWPALPPSNVVIVSVFVPVSKYVPFATDGVASSFAIVFFAYIVAPLELMSPSNLLIAPSVIRFVPPLFPS